MMTFKFCMAFFGPLLLHFLVVHMYEINSGRARIVIIQDHSVHTFVSTIKLCHQKSSHLSVFYQEFAPQSYGFPGR